MEEKMIRNFQIQEFSDYLIREEKSNATHGKYLRDVHTFVAFAGNNQVTKELVVAWKKMLVEQGYAVRSINSMLASIVHMALLLLQQSCIAQPILLQEFRDIIGYGNLLTKVIDAFHYAFLSGAERAQVWAEIAEHLTALLSASWSGPERRRPHLCAPRRHHEFFQ